MKGYLFYHLLSLVLFSHPCWSASTGREWQMNLNICPPILCGPQQSGHNQHEPGQSPFYEGDIVLDKELWLRMKLKRFENLFRGSKRSLDMDRRGIVKTHRLWPNAIVPYKIEGNLGSNVKATILKALKHYEAKTCIRFKKRTRERFYINYVLSAGCWSFIGRTAPKQGTGQALSIGFGCENLGTIVHETGHALGFWHEQSRNDRDKYVKVVKENIATFAKDQFKKRTANESIIDSKGYAYDYLSVMHYGEDYFSKNAQPTLKVIGPGKEFNFKIGQRKGLSNLDIAQLNDIYGCNKRKLLNLQVQTKSSCPKNFVRLSSGCYFFSTEHKNFWDSKRQCKRLNSNLLQIDSNDENNRIRAHLLQNFRKERKFRTGGYRFNREFKWYKNNGQHSTMKYQKWTKGQPKRNTLVYALTKAKDRYVWTTITDGVRYGYICETAAKCKKPLRGRGETYRGKINYSENGVNCQHWSSLYPHKHTLSAYVKSKKYGLGNHNYCRNPKGFRSRPWCFTTKRTRRWQYCQLDSC
ncbi:DgyrCDS1841 [Dimorphilus gyrociliatus]|uniref:Metalloendopeptidase n=1 Tax=Dimorphilus gyrociliatus TaxID=2664684 RepID=A0A7I8VBN4_9ANNE|nr:DgyrCDS1841 [Dimorphilus gyrociliatus]